MTIAIYVRDAITYRETVDGEYSFHPHGWFPKTQQKIFDWLLSKNVFKSTMKNCVDFYTIEEDDLLERLYHIRDACAIRDKRITHCYMGRKDFMDMMSIPEARFNGLIEYEFSDNTYKALGFNLTVLPYMEGILFV